MTRTSTCRTCGATLRGRRDKLFCDDVCRMSHHRSKASAGWMRTIDRVLLRNRVLLRKSRGITEVAGRAEETFAWLRSRGFDFNYHTHVVVLEDGRTAVMCYEEGYVVTRAGVVILEPMVRRRTG